MKSLLFEIEINASKQVVWEALVGDESYRKWTAPFMEGSYYEGSWNKGDVIKFLSPSGDGMSAEIAESLVPSYLSIKQIGEIKEGNMIIPEGGMIGYENYQLIATKTGSTHLVVTVDSMGEWDDYMQGVWPQALAILKELSEKM